LFDLWVEVPVPQHAPAMPQTAPKVHCVNSP
jgi:hypothetical protein